MMRPFSLVIVASSLVAASSTARGQSPPTGTSTSTAVTAQLRNGKGADVGHGEFRRTPNGVLLRVQLRGLPEGTHAMHVHETGRCDAPDFKSAGGHLAAAGSEHGFLDARGPHAGDLPNVHVGNSGELTIEIFAPNLTLDTGPRSVLDADGSALVIHADADDYHANPAGDAGNRIACGAIAANR